MNDEKEPRIRWEKIQEFTELYEQLGEWDRFIVRLHIRRLRIVTWIRRIPKRWVTWQMRARP